MKRNITDYLENFCIAGRKRPTEVIVKFITNVALLSLCCSFAYAGQQVTVTRSWPATGDWQVALSASPSSDMYCLFMADAGLDRYVGFIQMGPHVLLWVPDEESQTIELKIDGVSLGAFPSGPGGDGSSIAALTEEDKKRVFRLFRRGSEIEFRTVERAFSVSLKGAAESVANLDACAREASKQSKAGR